MKITSLKHTALFGALLTLLGGVTLTSRGAAPVPVTDIIDSADLVSESKELAEKIAGYVADEAAFDRALEHKTVATGAGTIACLAQALAEHRDAAKSGINAVALRDAAIQLSRSKELEAARAGLAAVNAALEGKGGKSEIEHPWNKLINMHRMMEEMELREGRLRRSLARPRRLEKDSRHATVLIALALALEADTHEVKNDADLPLWNKWSKEYRTAVTGVAKAMKAGDATTAKKLFEQSSETCEACHEKFRD